MRRFAVYRGKPGILVPHPGAGTVINQETKEPERSGRFAGQRKLSQQELIDRFGDGKRMPTLAECEMPMRYEPRNEAMADDIAGTLAKAVRKGELELVRAHVVARDLKSAKVMLAAMLTQPRAESTRAVAKPATTKGGE
jgi:hypothetical protein